MPDPTIRDIPYGPHERQRIDLWLAETASPTPFYLYIHGGGYIGGDKSGCPAVIVDELLKAGVSLAAMNYRFSDDPKYFALLHDAARALQFLRANAHRWNLDGSRVGAGGSSAGGDTAFWLGFGPERADVSSADPISRESTRLTCIASWQAQTLLDPLFIRKIINGAAWQHDVLQRLYRLRVDEYETPSARERFKEMAFTEMVTPEVPPVHLHYITPDLPMTADLDPGLGMHHPAFGRALKALMDAAGVECIVRTREELPELSQEEASAYFERELAAFVVRHLPAATHSLFSPRGAQLPQGA